jgi:pimeloyl-ACP methyl ester carboxylesterase
MADSSVVVDRAAISYGDIGSGPPLVFVHGAYVTGALWDDVAARLAGEHRCITPTFPFGAQRDPVGADVDLGVAASGRRIVKLLEALDLSDVTLIANDSGGGVLQAALADSTLPWHRVARLVFTNCDSFEHFPPASFAPLVRLCRLSATVGAGALRLLATGPGQAMFVSTVTRHGVDRARRPALFGGFVSSASVRREAARFTAGLHPRHTLAATAAIEAWPKPVLIAWGETDKLFPLSHGRRLADAFPHATLHTIADSSTYVMLDQAEETAGAIRNFVCEAV